MIPTKYQDESATIKHLLALGNPHKLEGGVGREWPDYLASGLAAMTHATVVVVKNIRSAA